MLPPLAANVGCLTCTAWRVQRRGSLDELSQPASSPDRNKPKCNIPLFFSLPFTTFDVQMCIANLLRMACFLFCLGLGLLRAFLLNERFRKTSRRHNHQPHRASEPASARPVTCPAPRSSQGAVLSSMGLWALGGSHRRRIPQIRGWPTRRNRGCLRDPPASGCEERARLGVRPTRMRSTRPRRAASRGLR